MKISEILSYHNYCCIAAMVLAIKENKYDPLIKIFGDFGSLEILKNIDAHISVITNSPLDLKYYPLPLFKENNYIYKNHYQVAASIICGLDEISIIYKKIGSPVMLKYETLDQKDLTDLGPYLSYTTLSNNQ